MSKKTQQYIASIWRVRFGPLTPRDLAVLLSYSETHTSRLICRRWTLSALRNRQARWWTVRSWSAKLSQDEDYFCCVLFIKSNTWLLFLFSDWSTLLNICSCFLSTTLFIDRNRVFDDWLSLQRFVAYRIWRIETWVLYWLRYPLYDLCLTMEVT